MIKKFFEPESWEVTRARGKIRYIFFQGVFNFGLPMSVLLLAVFPAIEGNHSFWITFFLLFFFIFPSMFFWFRFSCLCFRKEFFRSLNWLTLCFVFLFCMYLLNGYEMKNPLEDYGYIVIAFGCILGLIKSTQDWSDSEYAYKQGLRKRKIQKDGASG